MRKLAAVFFPVLFFFTSCTEDEPDSNAEMVQLLETVYNNHEVNGNLFSAALKVNYFNTAFNSLKDENKIMAEFYLSNAYLEMGKEAKAIEHLEDVIKHVPKEDTTNLKKAMKNLGIAWMRLGERNNCINNHGTESCIFPVQGNGIHKDKNGSERAIEVYESLLKMDPNDLESRWLINIAYMTIGGYPDRVPKKYLLKIASDTSVKVKPFTDVAMNLGINVDNLSGGSIVEDFNNDGYLDIVTSSWSLKQGMHYWENNKDGTFSDRSEASGLKQFTGGLHIVQTDYDNDGHKDIFVPRGAWKQSFGKEPNSLLRNNGDGTFTDVTVKSGLLTFCPTQAVTWADFNNDGWLDVFIGNETTSENEKFPCEFYINNQDGTFTNVAKAAGLSITAFIKGVTSGDYDNDGLTDIFISTLTGYKILLKNKGSRNGVPYFENVSEKAGIAANHAGTFATWFWDYDNDGWLDILVNEFNNTNSLAFFAASEALGKPVPDAGQVLLYRNNHDGTFENVSAKAGLNKVAFSMGSNFGDIDNDGYLDFYLGTGNPDFTSLIPNKLFRNNKGISFQDVTSQARVGTLQKGHGVSFADLDNDGDQDIHTDLGGAYDGDGYQSALYLNPGQANNNWIKLTLKGTKANAAAIGARIKVYFKEDGAARMVCRDVNAGGSFGANPLMQHIGIGKATVIDKIEIKWPGSGTLQTLNNIEPWQNLVVTEGNNNPEAVKLGKLDFQQPTSSAGGMHMHH